MDKSHTNYFENVVHMSSFLSERRERAKLKARFLNPFVSFEDIPVGKEVHSGGDVFMISSLTGRSFDAPAELPLATLVPVRQALLVQFPEAGSECARRGKCKQRPTDTLEFSQPVTYLSDVLARRAERASRQLRIFVVEPTMSDFKYEKEFQLNGLTVQISSMTGRSFYAALPCPALTVVPKTGDAETAFSSTTREIFQRSKLSLVPKLSEQLSMKAQDSEISPFDSSPVPKMEGSFYVDMVGDRPFRTAGGLSGCVYQPSGDVVTLG